MAAQVLAFKGGYSNMGLPIFRNGKRYESLPYGDFEGDVDAEGNVSNVSFSMKLPRIPLHLLAEVVTDFRRDTRLEAMVNIYYSVEGGFYYLQKPEYTATKVAVYYQMPKNGDVLVMQVHSHNTMPAIFSGTDDEDEVMTGLYLVIGKLDKPYAQFSLRAGMEGSFKYLELDEIFGSSREVA